jgi:hypothetical protein
VKRIIEFYKLSHRAVPFQVNKQSLWIILVRSRGS